MANHKPVVTQTEIEEPGVNRKYLEHSLQISTLPMYNSNDPAQVADRVRTYFEICAQNDMKPNVPGLALSLGIERTTLWRWANGQTNKPPEVRAIIQKAYAMLNAYLEDVGMNGKVNPAAFIFAAKNHFGYRDQTDLVVAPETKELPREEVLIEEAKLLDD